MRIFSLLGRKQHTPGILVVSNGSVWRDRRGNSDLTPLVGPLPMDRSVDRCTKSETTNQLSAWVCSYHIFKILTTLSLIVHIKRFLLQKKKKKQKKCSLMGRLVLARSKVTCRFGRDSTKESFRLSLCVSLLDRIS